MKNFSISNQTSGADLGVWEGETPEDALEALSREAGYRSYAEACEVTTGYADDLAIVEIKTAGKISPEWMAGARCNGTAEDIVDWVQSARNVGDGQIIIDTDGSVWDGVTGHWLTQDQIDSTCAAIDRGV